MKHAWIFAVGVVLLLTTLACGGESLGAARVEPGDTIAVRDNRFDPRVLEVAAGTSVAWRFDGNSPHHVTGDGWASETRRSGSYERVFAAPGTYDYKCTLHTGMTGA